MRYTNKIALPCLAFPELAALPTLFLMLGFYPYLFLPHLQGLLGIVVGVGKLDFLRGILEVLQWILFCCLFFSCWFMHVLAWNVILCVLGELCGDTYDLECTNKSCFICSLYDNGCCHEN